MLVLERQMYGHRIGYQSSGMTGAWQGRRKGETAETPKRCNTLMGGSRFGKQNMKFHEGSRDETGGMPAWERSQENGKGRAHDLKVVTCQRTEAHIYALSVSKMPCALPLGVVSDLRHPQSMW